MHLRLPLQLIIAALSPVFCALDLGVEGLELRLEEDEGLVGLSHLLLELGLEVLALLLERLDEDGVVLVVERLDLLVEHVHAVQLHALQKLALGLELPPILLLVGGDLAVLVDDPAALTRDKVGVLGLGLACVLKHLAVDVVEDEAADEVLLAEVPDLLGLDLHGVHVHRLLVVEEGVAALLILEERLLGIGGPGHDALVVELGHEAEAADVATEEAGPQRELLQVLLLGRQALLARFVVPLYDLLEEVVGHAAVVAVPQLLGVLVVAAEGAGVCDVLAPRVVSRAPQGRHLVARPADEAPLVEGVAAEDGDVEVLAGRVPLLLDHLARLLRDRGARLLHYLSREVFWAPLTPVSPLSLLVEDVLEANGAVDLPNVVLEKAVASIDVLKHILCLFQQGLLLDVSVKDDAQLAPLGVEGVEGPAVEVLDELLCVLLRGQFDGD
mmetsp:Transcript_5401/g.9079  ORF Transcript_5401/g.9079 Transcript_5401/m.9079 type:complete len:442 (+) Transcript_5401:400-1725(+)